MAVSLGILTVTAMATLERYQESKFQQASRTDSSVVPRRSSSETDWKTPHVSEKYQSRFGRCPSAAGSGDTAIGTSCSDSTEEFCNSSGSSSFQPIRSQVAIPTAHVMPSTLEPSPTKAQVTSEHSASKNIILTSSKSALSGSNPVTTGSAQTGDLNGAKATGLPVETLLSYRNGESALEQSFFPSADLAKGEDTRKFDTPNIEPTLNQSAFLDTIYSDPRHMFQVYKSQGTIPPETGKEPYKVLPESKAPSANSGVSEQLHSATLPSRTGFMPIGLQPSHMFPKPLALQSQMWRQEPYTMQPVSSDRSCDLNIWRQQQLDSMRLRVEQLQLLSGTACHQPAVYAPPLHSIESSRWDSVLKASETLLKEKDMLVERQRQHISQLEQKVRESELQVHSALLSRTVPYGDVCMMRLQEMQRENSFLRAQFAEKAESFSKEKSDLEKKLAASEVDVKELQKILKETTQKHTEEMKKQEERVKGRDKHINTLKKKCQKESEQNRESQQRIETLERYLADLPTREDHQKQSQQLKELNLKSSSLQDKVVELEKKLSEARAACRERDTQLEIEKRRELELLSTVHSLQEKTEQCLKNRGGIELPSQEAEDLQQNQALQKERDCLKKVIESQQKKMEHLSLHVKDLEEQVVQEEGTAQALKEEVRTKDAALQQLRAAVKELSLQNQDLMEKHLTLQEQLRQVDHNRPLSGESDQLIVQLHQELARCLQDLQSVCSVVTQRAQGKDPNLSLLLGIHSAQSFIDEQKDLQDPESIAKKLAEVKQLHKDIEDLRTAISDRYAQDMGDNCITQ
ncbi:centrosomal protein of 85 kDa isoform X2 [Rhinatrema bivittatum]|uniref:centrosomal protein of 85 kDa isoform X2 n=1 Tax=Rhinatrema bivittatum TaxID=194408 RepID=UPI00112664E0|nr:centrosomal protein of 85 kDa isoform X2 [Rhinatrema bivittatum]